MASIHNRIRTIIINGGLLLSFASGFAQEVQAVKEEATVKIDSLYREDQFFFSFTYNTLQNKPADFSQSKFATGFSAGFVRDMPIVKDRTVAIASGLGFTYNNYNQNLAITGTNELPVYNIVDTDTYSKSKFSQLFIDVPLELRWRTSTYQSYKFWRIYGGVKLSYLLYNKSVFNGDSGNTTLTNNKDFNKVLYGLYLAVGNNSINVYTYYGLNPIFKNGTQVDGQNLSVQALNMGLIFYIL